MKYFVDDARQIYSYDDGTSDEYVQSLNGDKNLRPITEDEVKRIQDPDGKLELKNLLNHLLSQVNTGFDAAIQGYEFTPYSYSPSLENYSPPPDSVRYYEPNHDNNSVDDIISVYDYYSDTEKQTFELQYKEAVAYQKSNYTDTTLCPTLVMISNIRGVTLKNLVLKVIEKYSNTNNSKIKNIGLKGKYMDMIIASKNNISRLRELDKTITEWLKWYK